MAKEKEKEKKRGLKLTPYFLKGMPSFIFSLWSSHF